MKVPPLNLNKTNYLIQTDGKFKALGRKFVTALNKDGALLPVLLLESTVTGGRTYQAYQRDGFVEARERITEESLAAVFWLFGAKMFGKLFDKLGQKYLQIPKDLADAGRDMARTPFANYIKDKTKELGWTAEKAESMKKFYARYSVGKTAASLITACLFIGLVVPKLNQAITKHLYNKASSKPGENENTSDKLKSKMTLKEARSLFWGPSVSINAVENFKARVVSDNTKSSTPKLSFKGGADSLLRIVQNFEENDVWKLMGTDVGTVTGRTANARNKDERVEIMFRDISSIYFYCFSMPAIVAFMNRKDTFKGLNTKLNPMSAAKVHNYMIEAMDARNMNSMPAKTFEKFILGNEDIDKSLVEKIYGKHEPKVTKKYLFGLFKKEVEVNNIATLSEVEKAIDSHYTDINKARELKELARKMAEMQPEKAGEKVVTELQFKNVLKGGILRKPEFLKEVVNDILKTKTELNPLGNKYKYVSIDSVEEYCKQIQNYGQAIVDDALKNNSPVTWDSMKKMNKRNLRKGGLFMALAMGVSSLFLSTIIPKVQYYITYKRTGKNSFPGVENMQEKNKPVK